MKAMDDFTFGGWTPIMAPAVKADDNPSGNQGGAMVLHKPWLQTATPAVAEGPLGRDLPEDDLAWKHFRIKGLHIVIGAIYFDHTIKLAGPNLHKSKRAVHLTDNGRRLLVLPGDFNMEPDEWDQQLLQDAGLQILTAGNENTCKTSHGSKQTTTSSSASIWPPLSGTSKSKPMYHGARMLHSLLRLTDGLAERFTKPW
jgi:hypothetical protein